jgi:HAD superfamily hydrolase (TIGR01549 family)
MSEYIPAYFQRLGKHLEKMVAPELFQLGLRSGVKAMEANNGSGITNDQAFLASFCPAVGYTAAELRPVFEQFYAHEYPKLRSITKPIPEARKLVDRLNREDIPVVIATNPLYPVTAVEQRLAWAGIPVTDFDYSLITTFEHMHAAKPQPEYYQEILERLNQRPEDCLMVGDDWNRDIVPATSVGIPVYQILGGESTGEELLPEQVDPDLMVGRGTLKDFWDSLRTGKLSRASFQRRGSQYERT